MKPAAIILAAGESRRMGRPKALLPFRDGTFLSVLANTLGQFCAPVLAVFGFDGERVAAAAPQNTRTVINHDYRNGMLTSLQAGLRALGPGAGRVMFTLVDHPAVSRHTLAALIEQSADIVIPRINGKRGHPVLIGEAIAKEFIDEPSTSKVRDVIDRHAAHIEYLDVNDTGITDDIDSPDLYEALLAREAGRA